MSDSTLAVALDRVHFRYPGWPWQRVPLALRDVSLSVERGTCHALVGANGSGKSTLLAHVAGVLHAATGDVRVLNRDANHVDVRRARTWLPEESQGDTRLRVEEALDLQAALYTLPRHSLSRRKEDVLESTGLTALRRRPLKTLSKGQRRRAGLAQALLPEPALLLLDEPFNGVDPVWCDAMRQLLAEYVSNGGTALVSTHRLEDVTGPATSLSLFREGQLLRTGSFDDLTAEARAWTLRIDDAGDDALGLVDALRKAGATLEPSRRPLAQLLSEAEPPNSTAQPADVNVTRRPKG